MPRTLPYDYAAWYEANYTRLVNCGLWLKGGEINTLPKTAYARRPWRILFTRLSTYADVATSFTHELLYEIAARTPGVYPDLAYLPHEYDVKVFADGKVPWLLGTTTKYGPEGFDAIGFSNSIVQELINIPHFLATGNIPLSFAERMERADIPLIILGGANAPFTSVFRGADAPVDIVYTGRDEKAIAGLLKLCAAEKRRGTPKKALIKKVTALRGCYPACGEAPRHPAPDTDPAAIPSVRQGIVLYDPDAVGAGHLAISEGCRASCSFCAESWTHKPYRELPKDALVKDALALKAAMGLDRINIASFNFNMHTDFYQLVRELIPFFTAIGLKSQRFDMLGDDPSFIRYQIALGKTTFSAGLEGISPRLRRYLNKNLDEAALYDTLDRIFEARARELKIFLLSTGLEEGNDFEEFNRFLITVKRYRDDYGASTRVILSTTPLVRFPLTPLEFDDAPPAAAHAETFEKIRRMAVNHGFQAREAMSGAEYLVSQILARAADDRIRQALIDAIRQTRFIYYRAIPSSFLEAFLTHLRRRDLPIKDLLAGSTYEESLKKPWAAIETGIDRAALWDIFVKNKAFAENGSSAGFAGAKRPDERPDVFKEAVAAVRQNASPKEFRVTIAEGGRGLPPAYIGTALARALMTADTSLAAAFHSYGASHWSDDPLAGVWVTGDDVLTLRWDRHIFPHLDALLADPRFLAAANKEFARWGTLTNARPPAHRTFAVTVASPFPFVGAAYCKARGLKYTLMKNADGGTFAFSKDASRKGIITTLIYQQHKPTSKDPSCVTLTIAAGPKFRPHEFMKEAFIAPEKNDWTRIRVNAQLVP